MTAFELHSVEGIKECFEQGVNPNEILDQKPLLFALINMYTRGPLFKNCVQAFVDYGLSFDDKVLLSVLLDDAALLDTELAADKSALAKTIHWTARLHHSTRFPYCIFVLNTIIWLAQKY